VSLPVFPSLPGITFPVKRAAVWSSTKHESLSGKRVRISYYSYPLYQFEVAFNFLRSAAAYLEWQQLAGFINQLTGGTGAFLFQDPNDYQATAQTFGIGDGVTTTFQLVRSLGGFVEPVFAPDSPITTIAINGTPTGAYTVSSTGSIVFNTAPSNGAALTWTGTFKWVCRFDDDAWGFENFALNLFELKALKFSSEKLV
jgi:uncharacterized protein (TIGR02217 family)